MLVPCGAGKQLCKESDGFDLELRVGVHSGPSHSGLSALPSGRYAVWGLATSGVQAVLRRGTGAAAPQLGLAARMRSAGGRLRRWAAFGGRGPAVQRTRGARVLGS